MKQGLRERSSLGCGSFPPRWRVGLHRPRAPFEPRGFVLRHIVAPLYPTPDLPFIAAQDFGQTALGPVERGQTGTKAVWGHWPPQERLARPTNLSSIAFPLVIARAQALSA